MYFIMFATIENIFMESGIDIRALYLLDPTNGVISSILATITAYIFSKIIIIKNKYVKVSFVVFFCVVILPIVNIISGNAATDAAKKKVEEAKVKYEAAVFVQKNADSIISEATRASKDAIMRKELADRAAAEAEERRQRAEKALEDANAKKQLADKYVADAETRKVQTEKDLVAADKIKRQADKDVEKAKNAYLEPVFGPNSRIGVPK